MKKCIFWDKSVVFIEDEQQDSVELAMSRKNGFKLNHVGAKRPDWVAHGSIARITQANYQEYQHLLPKIENRIEAPKAAEPTPEQIAKTEKLKAEIREKLFKKKGL